MSDTFLYELEDLQWDEFGESDDHIVPYQSDEQQDGYGVQEKYKRPRYELTSVSNRDESRNLKQSKEGKSCLTLKEMRGTMLEKTSGSYSSNGAVLASRDSCPNKKASSTASEPNGTNNCSLRTNTNNSVGEELCDGDPILGDQVENNSFQYQLNQVTEPVSDLGFFNNVQQDKENGDLLYYGWPEIENFEDVDKMFRSCDSTFGLGIDNEDELSWFSSSHAIEDSNDALEPKFKFPGPDSNALNDATDCDGILKLNDDGCVIDETYERDTIVCWNSSSETLDANNTAVVMNSSVESGSEATTQIDAGDQSMPHQSQKKLQTCGKRRGQSPENGESFIPLDKSNQMGDRTQRLWNSCQCNSSQTTEYEQPTQLFTRNKPHMVKSEDNGRQYLSQNESSYASSQMQHKESCHDVSFQIPGIAEEKKKAQSHQGGFSLHREHAGLAVQSASSDPIIAQKKTVNIESEVDGHSGVDESGPSIPSELDSSNVQDSACLRSMVDEVPLEASSFLQLQHVIEKLDVKTKLCIRDSLYRLANSAEQRHKCAILTTGGKGDGDESNVLASDETNKCTGFMDMETDTNPIDRSVAHLLFHRPSDPSVVPAVDTIPLTMVQNPCAEKLVSQEKSNDAGAE